MEVHLSMSHTHEQLALQETDAGTEGDITRERWQRTWVSQDAVIEVLSCEWAKMTRKVLTLWVQSRVRRERVHCQKARKCSS